MSKFKAAKEAGKLFEYYFDRLLRGFRKDQGREPENLEMILIKQEAGNKAREADKVIEVQFGKPFGEEVDELIKKGEVNIGTAPKTPPYEKSQADIEFEIMEKIRSDNEKAVRAFESRNPNKKPEDKATGGRAGYGLGSIIKPANANQNQNTSGVDPRMFLDYDTLVEQNVDKRLQNPNFLNNIQGVKAPEGTLGPITKMPVGEGSVAPILPVEPKNQPGSLEEYLSGYEEYKAKNPNTYVGTQALIPAMLPGGFQYTFSSGPHANHFNDYLRSIGLSPYEKYIDESMIEKLNQGGRAGYYTGGIIDVEPNLSDIGHGSDALMARTRLVSPDGQATTSTGLNYLLAEDNDNIRVPFSKGKVVKEVLDKGRRGFMKAAGAAGAGIAALKTGLLGFGEKAAPVVEKVTENFSSTASEAPQYFLDLVTKIKSFGKQSKVGPSEMMDEYYYTGKNGDQYTLTEDIATGDVQIVKDKMGVGSYGDKTYDTIDDRTVLEFRAGRMDVKDEGLETQKGFREADEYEEYKVEFDSDGTQAGAEAIDESVQKEILEEASEKITKKADGGRIGYSKGKAVMGFLEIIKDPKKIREAIDNIFKTGDYKIDAEMAAESLVELNPQAFGNKLYDDLDDKTRMQVYSAVIDDVMGDVGKKIKEKKTDTYRFLKKVFGDSLDDMPDRDPELYQGLKEVVPIFRQKDKAKKKQELIMYMQKYLPHMSDSEIEEFIVGSRPDIEGLSGQLLRLGSGRDYKGKLDMMREASQKRKLADLEVTEEMIRKPNAFGGIAKLLGE